METIKSISKLITDKNYLFQIILPGIDFMHGRTTVAKALIDKTSVEDYINSIVSKNNAKNVLIKLFSVNGSSFKNRGEHLIFLNNSDAVATNATNVATNATNVATNATNVAINNLGKLPENLKTENMTINDIIDYRVLKHEHKILENERDNLKSKVNQLEKKVEELHDERLKLVKENSVSSERHALALERQKLESEKESKSGLSGVIEDLNENPELIKMIAGFVKPDHPMFKESQMGNAGQLEEANYHSDPDANNVLKELPKLFNNVDPALVIRFYTIAVEAAKDPVKIEQVFKQVYPNL